MAVTEFGQGPGGEAVFRVSLAAGEISVALLTWGAALQSVRLAGVGHDLTLGSDRLEDYLGDMRYHGTLIGPVVNRIAGGRAVIAGVERRFERNLEGRHTLHSGSAGTHLRNWRLVEEGHDFCRLAIRLPDGEGGFPGNREVEAHFQVAPPASLTLTLRATTDATTILNFANHSYWNLDGAPDWAGHRLRVAAAEWMPTDGDFLPTGEVLPVAGSPVDFREMRATQPRAPDLDMNFCVARARGPLREVLWLEGPRAAVTMTVATTEPGVQLYDGRNAFRPGRGAYEGLAIECQGWPDAPNHAGFPPITLAPGEVLEQVTRWRFAR
jgi:aldose 1-epimerase